MTDLLEIFLEKEIRVGVFPVYKFCNDIETPRELEKAREFSDLVTVGRTVLEGRVNLDEVRLGQEEKDMLRYLESEESLIRAHPECPEVFNKLSINWDGTLTACCTDSDNKMLLGSIQESSMAEIWKSNKLDSLAFKICIPFY